MLTNEMVHEVGNHEWRVPFFGHFISIKQFTISHLFVYQNTRDFFYLYYAITKLDDRYAWR